MAEAWMRILTVRLMSKPKNGRIRELRFGENWKKGQDDLSIEVTGKKYMSSLKDTCTIKIKNLTYSEIIQIIKEELYNVEVICGYRNGNEVKIFKGGVLYVSNNLDDTKTNTIIILCASDLVASYGRQRLNLNLSSGINLYAAINVAAKKAGIPNANISQYWKTQFLQDVNTIDQTIGSWLDQLSNNNSTMLINSDSIGGSAFSIFNGSKGAQRKINLQPDNIDLSGGYPQLTDEGLLLSIMPTFGFMCGDLIHIDNSLINVSVTNQTQVQKNYGFYFDTEGLYYIYQIDFRLTNRNSDFSMNLLCKSKSLFKKFITT